MILKIFSPKKLAKILAFFSQATVRKPMLGMILLMPMYISMNKGAISVKIAKTFFYFFYKMFLKDRSQKSCSRGKNDKVHTHSPALPDNCLQVTFQ
jgi:hypothetical protein